MTYYSVPGIKDVNVTLSHEDTVKYAQTIAMMVAHHFKIPTPELYKKTRKAEIIKARHIAMWFVCKKTRLSLTDIGGIFGGRDHTTVIHARQQINNQLDPITGENDYKTAVKTLRAII